MVHPEPSESERCRNGVILPGVMHRVHMRVQHEYVHACTLARRLDERNYKSLDGLDADGRWSMHRDEIRKRVKRTLEQKCRQCGPMVCVLVCMCIHAYAIVYGRRRRRIDLDFGRGGGRRLTCICFRNAERMAVVVTVNMITS